MSEALQAPALPDQRLKFLIQQKSDRVLYRVSPWYCAKYGARCLKPGGAIVFVSGCLNRRPGLNCSPLGSANGAIEALTRSLALELGPKLRVNCLCPGFVDTERFDHLPPDRKASIRRTQ